MGVLSPEQCRSARVWLDWSQNDLVQAAEIGIQAIYEFELRRRVPQRETLTQLQKTFEKSGIGFLFDERDYPNGIMDTSVPNEIGVPMPELPLTRQHCKAARAWLNWTQQDLCDVSGVSLSTIRDFENDRKRRGRRYQPLPENQAAMKNSFIRNGLVFLFTSENTPIGFTVRLRNKMAA
jgi:transcriptional regulator with XRE-family HTH domain